MSWNLESDVKQAFSVIHLTNCHTKCIKSHFQDIWLEFYTEEGGWYVLESGYYVLEPWKWRQTRNFCDKSHKWPHQSVKRYFSTVLHRSATLYNAKFMTDFLKIVYDTLVWQFVRLITGIDKLTSLLRLQDIIATFQDRIATLYDVKFMTNFLKKYLLTLWCGNLLDWSQKLLVWRHFQGSRT